jgi:cysteine desulfurase
LIYFDYAAAAPIAEEALEVFIEASRRFYANSSSLHDEGFSAKELLELSRKQLAETAGITKEGVIFTSGGSESNMLALQIYTSMTKKNHIIASSTEHSSLSNYLKNLKGEGYEITYLKHSPDGRLSLAHLQESIKDTTFLVICGHVNSEIGCVQDLAAIKEAIGTRDIFLHGDCVQSFGKLNLEEAVLACDSLSISAHKIYGPKGTGALLFPAVHKLKPPIPDVSHEMGFRTGTVNVPAIASFATAAALIETTREDEFVRISALRKQFKQELLQMGVPHEIIESPNHQLPHIIGVTFPGHQGQYVMLELNSRGYAVSTGSACQIGKQEPSKTMMAIGKSNEEAKSLIRISMGKNTTENHISGICRHLCAIINNR